VTRTKEGIGSSRKPRSLGVAISGDTNAGYQILILRHEWN